MADAHSPDTTRQMMESKDFQWRLNFVTGSPRESCAACRYQRRKCTPYCILAPYFPPHRPTQFSNAHKLYGVANMVKIIEDIEPSERDNAMKTIIYESDARANDPVGGCYRIVQELEAELRRLEAEVDEVRRKLDTVKSNLAQQQVQHYDFI